MDFEWDPPKSAENRIKRDLPFGLVAELFAGRVLTQDDDRRDYGEPRVKATGIVGTLVVVCIYTDRGETRRIISLRRANRRERNAFRTSIGG